MPTANGGSYDSIAAEYYSRRHVTSRNFDAATDAFLNAAGRIVPPAGYVLDLGAGRGSVAARLRIPATRIIQLDLSRAMLKLEPREQSLGRIQASALSLPFQPHSIGAVVAFLYDPFNTPQLYEEIHRVLRPGGMFIGTLPHYLWANALRGDDPRNLDSARFITKAGEILVRSSFVMPRSKIVECCKSAMMRVLEIEDLYLPLEITEISPDIVTAAAASGCSPYELPIVQFISAVPED